MRLICWWFTVNYFSKRAQIKRIIAPEKRTGFSGSRAVIDVDLRSILSKDEKFNLVDGDIIQFFDIDNQTIGLVEVNGSAVVRPGSYQLIEGKVVDLILKADSLRGDAFLDRAEILRTNDDKTESLIIIELDKALDGDPANNINLKSRDVLTIKSNSGEFFIKLILQLEDMLNFWK